MASLIYTMQMLVRSRRILSSSLATHFGNYSSSKQSSTLQVQTNHLQNGDFLKWGGSLGFCRTSSFATGFNPLQRKPLDSIIDIQRVQDRSPEEISDVWDDVISFYPPLVCLSSLSSIGCSCVLLSF